MATKSPKRIPKSNGREAESQVPMPRKRKVLACLGAAILLSAAAVSWYAYEQRQEKLVGGESPKDVQQQYRDQLPDLKKKAEGNAVVDLQNYAIAQYATGDAGGAEQTYRKQIEQGGASAMIRNNLGNTLRDQKKFEEAVKEYEEAIAQDKSFLSAYYNLASVYQYSLRDVRKAIETYKRGIENNPSVADLFVLLGVAYEQLGEKGDARDAYGQALEIQPANQAAKDASERLGAGAGEEESNEKTNE